MPFGGFKQSGPHLLIPEATAAQDAPLGRLRLGFSGETWGDSKCHADVASMA